MTFRFGAFGVFGLYCSRYQNFPFKSWKIWPSSDDPKVIFLSLEVKYTTMEFEVTGEGIKCGIYVKTKSFLTELVPVVKVHSDLEEVKKVS